MNLYKLHNNPEKLKYYHQISDKLNDNNVLVFKNVKGLIHRDEDKPAVVRADGSQYWLKNSKFMKSTWNGSDNRSRTDNKSL